MPRADWRADAARDDDGNGSGAGQTARHAGQTRDQPRATASQGHRREGDQAVPERRQRRSRCRGTARLPAAHLQALSAPDRPLDRHKSGRAALHDFRSELRQCRRERDAQYVEPRAAHGGTGTGLGQKQPRRHEFHLPRQAVTLPQGRRQLQLPVQGQSRLPGTDRHQAGVQHFRLRHHRRQLPRFLLARGLDLPAQGGTVTRPVGRGWRGAESEAVRPPVDGVDDPLSRHLQLWQEYSFKTLVHTRLWTAQQFTRPVVRHQLHPAPLPRVTGATTSPLKIIRS